MVQPDMKKLVAYSSVSHLGFVVLGLCAMNLQGVQGSLYQMLNHGVSTGGLFMIVGMLSDRRHTRLISEFGGLKSVTPRLVAAFLLVTLSSIALPGLNGFVGEFLIMLGAFRWDPRYVVGAGLGVILSAVYMLWMFQRVFFGDVTNEKNAGLKDLSPREILVFIPLLVMIFWFGVYSKPFTERMEPSVTKFVEQMTSVRQAMNSRDERGWSPTGAHKREESSADARTTRAQWAVGGQDPREDGEGDGRAVTMARSPAQVLARDISYRAADSPSSDHRDHPATVVNEVKK